MSHHSGKCESRQSNSTVKNFIFALVLFLGFTAFGATYCVGPSATGSGSGSDWNNLKAWSATPARGDTWYLVSGSYAGKTLSVAASGSTPVTFKKATASNYTDITTTGWNSSMAGQAAITGTITVNSSYWVIDGQTGGGFSVLPPDTNGSNYGIAMTQGAICVTIPPPSGNLTLSHIYASAILNDPDAGAGYFVSDGNSGSGTVDSVTLSYCLLVGWGQAIRADKTWSNLLFDHNCYWTIYASSAEHANPINASWGEIDSAVVRYSLFYKNIPGTWGFSQVIAANNNNWNNAKIYGNVFDHCWAGRSIISGNGRSNDAVYGTLVYNNTFLWSALGYPNDGGGLIGDEVSSGNTFVNNLAYDCNATVGSCSTDDYNEYVATWNQPTETHGKIIAGSYNPFTSAATQIYSLLTNTPAGTSLASEYNTDALGHTRTTWTRGAFEFGSGGPSTNPVVAVSPGALDLGGVLTNTTSTNLTLRVQNVGAGTLSGTATVSAPFQIIAGGTYSLGANQSQQVTIRFSPLAAGYVMQTVTFTGGGGATATVSGTGTVNQPGLSFNSTSGSISAPFTISSGYLSQAVVTGVINGGQAVYAFNLTNAGSYVIMANVNAPSTAANSFYVNIDAQPSDPTMIWDVAVSTGFTNQLVSWRGNGTYASDQYVPAVFNLTGGAHQLIVRGCEAGVQLGQITITPYEASPPSPPLNLHIATGP
jgi:hypothetical protein